MKKVNHPGRFLRALYGIHWSIIPGMHTIAEPMITRSSALGADFGHSVVTRSKYGMYSEINSSVCAH